MEKELKKIWDLSKHYKKDYEPDVDAGFSKFKQKLKADKDQNVAPLVVSIKRRRINWLAIAASVALVLTVGWIWTTLNKGSDSLLVEATQEGRLKEVRLADGTSVFLNEKSELQFPKSFRGKEKRVVRLEGEAYFNVVENPDQPFIIQTAETEVKVLGTSFNLRAYEGEKFTEVEVESGMVAFKGKEDEKPLMLAASKKGVCMHGGEMLEKQAPNLNAHAWRTKVIKFRNTPVEEVVSILERHFKVDINIAAAGFKDCTFTHPPFVQQPLEGILESMATALNAKLEPSSEGTYTFYGGFSCGKD